MISIHVCPNLDYMRTSTTFHRGCHAALQKRLAESRSLYPELALSHTVNRLTDQESHSRCKEVLKEAAYVLSQARMKRMVLIAFLVPYLPALISSVSTRYATS